ncbi:glycosyltransferase family 61 protein [Krasilnikoviella flava]|uniref:glycosyltransferase family 61 protein n=1 Tax=Krasilnikoviella flava TaxID=526729 RepID=UPI0009A8D48C|nr:glycosyltransferase 61 family protein [Krasilnikoviella flava]
MALGRSDEQQHRRTEGARRRVVVVADDVPPAVLRTAVEPYRDEDLFVIAPTPYDEWALDETHQRYLRFVKESNLQWYLKLHGPVDRIVDVRQRWPKEHEATLRKLLFHLLPGGEYVIPRSALTGYKEGNPLEARLARFARALSRGEPDDDDDFAELSRAVAQVRLDREEIVVRKSGTHYLKLSDRWANRLLSTRNGGTTTVQELALLPEQKFASSTTIDSHGASRPLQGLETTVAVPPHHLRHYEGRIGLVSHSLTYTAHEILPDSFRHHLSNSRNRRLVQVDENFARIPRHVQPVEELAGSYYLLDSENSGHYGHLMTEVISRLWGWDAAKADDPGLKAVFRLRYAAERDPRLERTVLAAFGIGPEDVVTVDHPVYLESMYAATPMFHNARPYYVHPEIRAVWRRIRDGLPADPGPTWDRVFVSRKDRYGNRRCLNRVEVEDYFAEAGFQVIYPEEFSLGRQAEIFARARAVAGFGGSAMFNTLFAENLEHMIVLTQEAYTARNEALIALPLGVRMHYFWNQPRIPHPPGGWAEEAYKSDWTFDFSRHRSELSGLVRSL